MKTFEQIAEELWLIRVGDTFKYGDHYLFTITSIEDETVYCKTSSGRFGAERKPFERMLSLEGVVKV